MTDYSSKIEEVLEDFENMSDFYDNTEAMIIRRFYLLNKHLNENNDPELRNKLQNTFGEFLVDTGKVYIKASQNQDE